MVRIDARIKDYVVDGYGRHLKRTGRLGETTRMREFWTLGRRGEHWVLVSIEQGAEGKHALDEQIVATPWADERGMRDEAMVEAAVADAVPEGTKIAEVADLQFSRATPTAPPMTSAWPTAASRPTCSRSPRGARSTPGPRRSTATTRSLRGSPLPAAARELLYAGDASGRTRRGGPRTGGQADPDRRPRRGAEPPTMTIEVDLTGRRYLEDRDTDRGGGRQPLARRPASPSAGRFAHRRRSEPWRITAVGAPVGLA